jgi:hypothetical protein
MLSCGNMKGYELLAAGELDSFRDGRSRKITVESIHRYIQRRLTGAADGRRYDLRHGSAAYLEGFRFPREPAPLPPCRRKSNAVATGWRHEPKTKAAPKARPLKIVIQQ